MDKSQFTPLLSLMHSAEHSIEQAVYGGEAPPFIVLRTNDGREMGTLLDNVTTEDGLYQEQIFMSQFVHLFGLTQPSAACLSIHSTSEHIRAIIRDSPEREPVVSGLHDSLLVVGYQCDQPHFMLTHLKTKNRDGSWGDWNRSITPAQYTEEERQVNPGGLSLAHMFAMPMAMQYSAPMWVKQRAAILAANCRWNWDFIPLTEQKGLVNGGA